MASSSSGDASRFLDDLLLCEPERWWLFSLGLELLSALGVLSLLLLLLSLQDLKGEFSEGFGEVEPPLTRSLLTDRWSDEVFGSLDLEDEEWELWESFSLLLLSG